MVGQHDDYLQRDFATWPRTEIIQVVPGVAESDPPTSHLRLQREHLMGSDSRCQRDCSNASQGWERQGKEMQPGGPHQKRKEKEQEG